MADALLRVEGLRTELRTRDGMLPAVNGVSLHVGAGEIVGIVGESGCGKSMTAMSIMGLVPNPPGRVTAGRVLFDGRDLLQITPAELRKVRGCDIAMIFQDPNTFLNPVMTVEAQILETLKQHLGLVGAPGRLRVRDLLRRVRIADPDRVATAYPHQLSGGMRQRILIAIALSCEPRLIIADEPTTALDVTVQAQIMDLLRDLVQESGTSLLLITHDLGLVAESCDRVYVMYAGRVVEQAAAIPLFATPRHPYTVGLLRSALRSDERRSEIYALEGHVPDLTQPIPGCSFCDRCSERLPRCATEAPPAVVLDDATIACWRFAA